MPYLLASMKCTRCIFMECRRNRSPRASACFCYRLHAARSSARQNFRSHGHGSALCQTADCFPPREHLRIDLGSRVPQKAPFLHIFLELFRRTRGPHQPQESEDKVQQMQKHTKLPLFLNRHFLGAHLLHYYTFHLIFFQLFSRFFLVLNLSMD